VLALIVVDFEASFLRLLEKVTNGCKIVINVTGKLPLRFGSLLRHSAGTAISYKPGVIIGGKVSHDCGTARSIGYFLEAMIALAPFSKTPFQLTFVGITNGEGDLSVRLVSVSSAHSQRRWTPFAL
jgi:RNA 3'-terminal phosphate cyclase-like protein